MEPAGAPAGACWSSCCSSLLPQGPAAGGEATYLSFLRVLMMLYRIEVSTGLQLSTCEHPRGENSCISNPYHRKLLAKVLPPFIGGSCFLYIFTVKL